MTSEEVEKRLGNAQLRVRWWKLKEHYCGVRVIEEVKQTLNK